jgi:hypothetical protein
MTLKAPMIVPRALHFPQAMKNETIMSFERVQMLRQAIENLINVKLLDAIVRPGGADRLLANRVSGVASREVRAAEVRLEQALLACSGGEDDGASPLAVSRNSSAPRDPRERRADYFVDPT